MVSRQDVQQAAVRLFAEKGFAATGIRELASVLGINSGTLYHHAGGGKPELLSTIMRECLTALLQGGEEAVAVSADPARQLAVLTAAHVGFSAVNPLTAQVTDQEVRSLDVSTRTQLVAMRDAYESLFADVLDRGARSGIFELPDVRVTRLALLEMCNGVAHWYRPDGRLSCVEVQERFVEFAGRLVGCDLLARLQAPFPEPVRLAIEPVTDTRFARSTKEIPV
ncbi:MAG: TetR/AcrR family transcriptional regulator [Dermatophilaceae bacterium]|nr:TetR/AcrR family transcriptional regulator [Intrasporangiaceae bacterium]